MTDLIILMSKLVTPKGDILVPGISELVAPLTDEERRRYEVLDYSVSVCVALPLPSPSSIDEVNPRMWNSLQELRSPFRTTKQKCSWVVCGTHRYHYMVSRVHSALPVLKL